MSQSDSKVRALAESISRRTVLRDIALVVVWVGAVSVAFRRLGWSTLPYYLVVFGGILAYSLFTEP